MIIPLKPKAKIKILKVYNLGAKDRAFLDDVYNELYTKDKL